MAELTLPEDEAALLRAAYADANVILEYGSGGSTLLASSMPDKQVFSVESGKLWADSIRAEIAALNPPSPAILHHVNIGPTGSWGRPTGAEHWRKFYRYPTAIWDEPWFPHPDVVLIDGRFRAACLATCAIRITRPVTVLFDDYKRRKTYHAVEAFAQPVRMQGRMAIFELVPGMLSASDLSLILSLFAKATYAAQP